MKVGEKIQLYVENATVKVTIKDSIQTYSLVVTVTADTNMGSPAITTDIT